MNSDPHEVGLYEQVGFRPLADPAPFMELSRPDAGRAS